MHAALYLLPLDRKEIFLIGYDLCCVYVDRERTSLGQGEYKLLGSKFYPLIAHVGSNLLHNIYILNGGAEIICYQKYASQFVITATLPSPD